MSQIEECIEREAIIAAELPKVAEMRATIRDLGNDIDTLRAAATFEKEVELLRCDADGVPLKSIVVAYKNHHGARQVQIREQERDELIGALRRQIRLVA